MRQIVLDTETTGLDARDHRIIEIGCVELLERRPTGMHFHRYINPERTVDEGALAVHGLSNEFLADKPLFAAVVDEFLDFVRGAELIIHNASFDLGFLDAEFARCGVRYQRMNDHVGVLDTLALARERYPGQKNSLDALCKRLDVDNRHRELHGALLDAQLLAEVYLAMTAGQGALDFIAALAETPGRARAARAPALRPPLFLRRADAAEQMSHAARLVAIERASKGHCLWLRLEAETAAVAPPLEA